MQDTTLGRELKELGEYQLHRLIFEALADAQPTDELGDDCAVVPMAGDQIVLVNIDRLPRHCPIELVPRLLVAQALSDVICMGGTPIGIMPALSMPRETSTTLLIDLMAEISREASRYSAAVLGGDTKEGDSFSAVTCAIGVAPKSGLVRRRGASVGDIIAVTSTNGSPWGERWLAYLVPDIHDGDNLRARIDLPILEAQAVIGTGAVTSGADMSDGIGATCQLLATASQKTFELDYGRLEVLVDPTLTDAATRLEIPVGFLALSPGYVWENCYTIHPEGFSAAQAAANEVGGGLVEVGRVAPGPACVTFSDAPDSWLRLASDEKFVALAGGNQPAAWLELARDFAGPDS